MTAKRTHGPCTCSSYHPNAGHEATCHSLYPAQQEPDALTKLVRLIRMGPESGSIAHRDVFAVKALDLISEAREEQRKATIRAKNEGLEKIATWAEHRPSGCRDRSCKACTEDGVIAAQARMLKDSEP